MAFTVFLVVFEMLIPVTMLAFGYYFRNRAPKNINALFGYRTAMSMKSRETWEFAHRYFGRLWFKWGIVLTVMTAVLAVIQTQLGEKGMGIMSAVLCAVQTLVLIIPIIPTEKALKKNFDEFGIRKQSSEDK